MKHAQLPWAFALALGINACHGPRAPASAEAVAQALPELLASSSAGQEGGASGGGVQAIVSLSLSRPSDQVVSVDYASRSGTATEGADYPAVRGTATIAAGQSSTNIFIPITGDDLVEGEEQFSLSLSGVMHATLVQSLVAVSIRDDDQATPPPPPPPPPLVSIYADCYNPDQLTATSVAGHRCTWLHAALTLQDQLDREQPLQKTLWLATHNSANSSAYPGPSSSGDPNHSLTIPDQLALDLRGLELDVHWFPHTPSAGNAPVLCHALGANMNHSGCSSSDRHLREGLIEIAAFLDRPENREVVLMVDIENQLSDFSPPAASTRNAGAHDIAVALFQEHLGSRVYRPAGSGCQPLPLDLSKAQVIAAGKQILLTSDCGAGTGWTGWVYDIGAVRTQKANDGFDAYPDCESSFFSASDYSTRWTRVWHDSTDLGAQTNSSLRAIDAVTLTEMLRCGLHMPSLDQLLPNDPRAEAMVWSWAAGQPRAGTRLQCARHDADGHFSSADCAALLPYACRDASGGWLISAVSGSAGQGSAACAGLNALYATPATGADNQALRNAKAAAGVETLWLSYREVERIGQWQR